MLQSLWKGKLLTEFTKPELIEIIEHLNKMHEQAIEQKYHEIDMLRRI